MKDIWAFKKPTTISNLKESDNESRWMLWVKMKAERPDRCADLYFKLAKETEAGPFERSETSHKNTPMAEPNGKRRWPVLHRNVCPRMYGSNMERHF